MGFPFPSFGFPSGGTTFTGRGFFVAAALRACLLRLLLVLRCCCCCFWLARRRAVGEGERDIAPYFLCRRVLSVGSGAKASHTLTWGPPVFLFLPRLWPRRRLPGAKASHKLRSFVANLLRSAAAKPLCNLINRRSRTASGAKPACRHATSKIDKKTNG